jgi:hypothetical protein
VARPAGRGEGRRTLDFSEWGRPGELDEIVEAVEEGAMPPVQYPLLHPGARLTARQRQELAAGLEATLRASSAAAR